MSSTPYGVELSRLATLWAEEPDSTCFAALAEALRKRGAFDDAARVAADGVAARPDYLPGQLVMARICADRHDWDAADTAIEAALRLDATHPVALEARDAVLRRRSGVVDAPVAVATEVVPVADEEVPELLYGEASTDDAGAAEPVGEPVLTESLAMLYRGQGHLAQALDVLDALVARAPDDAALQARRDAVRDEFDVVRPRPYDAAVSGGPALRSWLSALASTPPHTAAPVSSLDAFFEAPATAPSEAGDLAAFQAWLRELER